MYTFNNDGQLHGHKTSMLLEVYIQESTVLKSIFSLDFKERAPPVSFGIW